MNTSKFKKFAAAFQSGGAAALCLQVIRYRSGVIKATDEKDVLYLEEIPRQIQEETAKVRNDINEVTIVDEIEEKLMSLEKSEREGYIHKVMLHFKDWADIFNSVASIKRLTAKVHELEARQSNLEPMKAEELEAVKGFLQKRKDIMAAAKSLLKVNRDVVFWHYSLIEFAHCLAAMLLRHQIDLMRLQMEFGIYLVKDIDLHWEAKYIGNEEYVKKLLNELPSNDKEPQQEDKKDNKTSQHFHSNLQTSALISIYDKLKSNGFISVSLEQWIYVCKGAAGEPVDKPIDWNGTQKTLTYLVGTYIGKDDENLWVIAANAFTYKGKKPNRNTMSVFMNSIKGITGYALEKQDKNIYNFSKLFIDIKI